MAQAIKRFRFIVIVLIFSSSYAIGQDTRNPISKFLDKRGYTFPDSAKNPIQPDIQNKWPDTLYYYTAYKSKLMGSFTVPITFSSIKIANGEALTSPNISLGLGYTWFYGDFIFEEDDKILVDPTFFFGVLGDAGIQNFSLNKLAGFLAGGFVGVGSFTLFGGFDLINRYALVGIGARVDFFTISQNFLHVYGKVHEVRKHKRLALPITGE